MAFVLPPVATAALRRCSFARPTVHRLLGHSFAIRAASPFQRRIGQGCCLDASPRMMATEQGVAPPTDASKPTIFDKILSREIPADVVFEDEHTLAFRDINPQAPVHVLVIPKRRITMLSTAQQSDKELLGHLMLAAAKVADIENLSDGYRVLVNNGKNGLQSVYHLHLHVIGGRKLKWGPF